MKKTSLAIALMMAILLVLTSCATTPTTTATTAGGTTVDTSATETLGPPTELIVAWEVFGTTPKDQDMVAEALTAVVEPLINVKVKFLVMDMSSAGQQLNLMLSSGEKLDLMMTMPYSYQGLVASGKIQEIGPLLDEYGQGIKDLLGSFLNGSTVNGKIYGTRPISDFGGGACMIIREKTVEDFNLDLSGIKSFSDVGKVLKAIKDKDSGITPLIGMPPMSLIDPYIGSIADKLGDSFGVLMNKGQDLTVVNLFETAEYAEAVNLVRDWYEAGYVQPDIATSQADLGTVLRSRTGYVEILPSKPGIGAQRFGEEFNNIAVEFSSPLSTSSNILLFQWVVPNACEHPDKAIQLLNLMYTNAEVANLMTWGIEGTHYVKNDDGSVSYPEGVDMTTVGYSSAAFLMGNEYLTYIFKGNDPNIWDKTKEFNSTITLSKAMGFSYDATSVKAEITELSNVYNQYKMTLETGAVDPVTVLPEFIAKLKAAGIEKVIAAKQQQFDAWRSANGIT